MRHTIWVTRITEFMLKWHDLFIASSLFQPIINNLFISIHGLKSKTIMKKKNQELEVEYFVRHRNIRKRKEYITRDSSFRKNQRSAVWNSRSVKLNFPEASAWHREDRLTRDYRYLSDNIASSMKWSLTEASILPPLVIRQFEN